MWHKGKCPPSIQEYVRERYQDQAMIASLRFDNIVHDVPKSKVSNFFLRADMLVGVVAGENRSRKYLDHLDEN
jgi:hypothetical protein